jgi:predicted O-methyltransferase YrrM
VTIDPDRDRTDRARAFWRKAGIADARITVVNAPALDAFAAGEPALAGPFDLAFIDALKPEYPAYFDALRPRLAPGALVIADNVLWSGRTSGSRPARDGDGTPQLRELCERLSQDPDFEATILPIGDGLLVAALRA